ncbi:MAG: hypothetical protein LBS50_01820 [Prevotellaceae bacterium]|jgi:hypothetical protein|nr:hypothetical protein [Prevotellaceae bacterium]
MNYLLESIESGRLQKLIDDKVKHYHKQVAAGNRTVAQFLQKEILFLQNDIMPLLLHNSNLAHFEMCKYVIRSFEKAVKRDCNALLCYIPIKADYKENAIVGIANGKQDLFFEPEAMRVFCNEITLVNTDGNEGGVVPINLNLNDYE